ncbi:hypothetical protein SCG7086_AY_00170 [Chlamydiales bacterium SCGC AG-110-P3]|nr:hypothetical protein SCG7086_AY_00170 [Chlamydiales bacterium SCGC AG-110-P3]
MMGNPEYLKFLTEGENLRTIKLSAMDREGDTVLHKACSRNEQEIDVVRHLVGLEKIKKNPRNKNKETPLHNAAALGHSDLVSELVENGANAGASDNTKQTPLHVAMLSDEDPTALAKIIIEGNPSLIREVDEKGNTPLHLAAQKGHEDMVSYIFDHLPFKTLDAATDYISKMNNEGKTAADLARDSGYPELEKRLYPPKEDSLTLIGKNRQACCCTVQ